MNDIKLSVIVPVYNTEEYLKKCLDSIVLAVINLKNKYQYNSEIIIINDGSKGDTKSIVNEYLNNFPRIVKYFEKTNSGLGATKNYGLNMAIGKYINFVDSDDYIDENTYCKVFDIIKKDNSDIVIYDFEAIPNNNKSFRTIAKNNNITDNKFGCIYTDIMPSSCNKVILKKIYDNESFPINLGYEDLGLTLLLLLKASKISYIPEMLYKYNLRENSIMRKKFDEKKLDMCDVLNILFSKLDNIENNENSDYIDKCKYITYTWRLYREIFEPIISEKFKDKIKLYTIMCNKLSDLNKKMCYNKYYIKNELSSGRILKKIFIKMFNFAINNKIMFILMLFDKKILYFLNQYETNKKVIL